MKTEKAEFRENAKIWANESNKDATESALTCMICLFLVYTLGITCDVYSAVYIVIRVYFAVFFSSLGMRFLSEFIGTSLEYVITVIMLSLYMVESAYVIIDEFVSMFCR